jgi:hypothetical protein
MKVLLMQSGPKESRSDMTEIRIRTADQLDARALLRLAALDSQLPPKGRTLIAEVDGEMVAAMPLAGGEAIADPFRRTSESLDLLALRASQLRHAA